MDWSRASFRDASFENRWRVAKRKHQMPTYYSTCLATFAPLHAPLPFTINSFSWTAPSPPVHSCIFWTIFARLYCPTFFCPQSLLLPDNEASNHDGPRGGNSAEEQGERCLQGPGLGHGCRVLCKSNRSL